MSINPAARATHNGAPCRVVRMDQLNGINVPNSLSDACHPERLGLLIYDMQVGIMEQIADREKVIPVPPPTTRMSQTVWNLGGGPGVM